MGAKNSSANGRPTTEEVDKPKNSKDANFALKELKEFPFEDIRKLEGIEKLNLAKNDIHDIKISSEDKEVLKQLAMTLKYLVLSDNPLKTIPEEFCDLADLEELTLSSMRLAQLPKSLGNLKKLKTLDVFLNRLTQINTTGLESLTKLLASWNYVKTLDVGDCRNLLILDVCSNNLEEIPMNLHVCQGLRDLRLRFNMIRTVPDLSLPNLTRLNLSHNFITFLPDSLESVENLVELKLDHNEITSIPLLPSKIQKVDLHFNKIKSFKYPFSSPNKTLENINLSNNEISELGDVSDLEALTYLDLCVNKIKEFPKKWPVAIDEIYLGNNLIEDVSDFCAPTLRGLFLSDNRLTRIPSSFFTIHKSLKTLSLAKNQITHLEDIPCTDSCKLENLFLGFNQISEFPKNFFTFYSSISVLDFSYNLIKSVPSELQNMSFNHIHMNSNLISETSLEVLQELSTMYMYLSDNKFSQTLDKDELDFEEGLRSDVDHDKAAGHGEMCGMRPSFEDSHVIEINFAPNKSLFAIFDGHGGALGAKKAAEVLLDIVTSVSNELSMENAILEIFKELETKVCEASFKNVEGATATVVMIHEDTIYSANLGDSRSILVSKNKVEQLSYEHKGYDRQEHDRIRETGGFITDNDRVQGIIGVPRALGDKGLKKYLSSDPYLSSRKITEDDLYCVIACDGVWDVLSNEAVAELLDPTLSCSQNARKIRDCAFALSSTDNISVIVINLKLLMNK
jgi:adenylate cyclase